MTQCFLTRYLKGLEKVLETCATQDTARRQHARSLKEMGNVPQVAPESKCTGPGRDKFTLSQALASSPHFQEIPNEAGNSLFSQITSTSSLLFPAYSF